MKIVSANHPRFVDRWARIYLNKWQTEGLLEARNWANRTLLTQERKKLVGSRIRFLVKMEGKPPRSK